MGACDPAMRVTAAGAAAPEGGANIVFSSTFCKIQISLELYSEARSFFQPRSALIFQATREKESRAASDVVDPGIGLNRLVLKRITGGLES
jgi:hypothetical protein